MVVQRHKGFAGACRAGCWDAGVKGPYEFSWQLTLLCASVQHLFAVALLFFCKKFCQHCVVVAQGIPCSACAC